MVTHERLPHDGWSSRRHTIINVREGFIEKAAIHLAALQLYIPNDDGSNPALRWHGAHTWFFRARSLLGLGCRRLLRFDSGWPACSVCSSSAARFGIGSGCASHGKATFVEELMALKTLSGFLATCRSWRALDSTTAAMRQLRARMDE